MAVPAHARLPSNPPLMARARRALADGRAEKAERLCAELLRQRPDDPGALHLLGMLNYQRGHPDVALSLMRRAAEIDGGCADVLSDMALVLLSMRRFEGALACYDRAHALAPDDAHALNGRSVALLQLGRTEEAIAGFDRVLAIDPRCVDALGNRGNALLKLNRPGEAIVSYAAALKLAPDNARLLTNHAVALRKLDRPHEALTSSTRALACAPDFAEAQFVDSLIRLSLGDFSAGWRGYESRWATAAFAAHRRDFAAPLWLGDRIGDRPLAGQTILLHGEQGYGDTIQFVRYASRVAALGARVVLEVQPELVGLLSRLAGIDAIVARGAALPAFDCHCPLMSLPLAFATERATIPWDGGYLEPPPDDAARWRKRLTSRRPLVGLVWAGDTAHINDHNRSLRLETLRPLLALPDVQFVSLQQELSVQDAAFLHAHPQPIVTAGPFRDFAETAAVIDRLDGVVAVDTAVAHLAGAMGKPLSLLLPLAADFRWLRDGRDSPWYPTARLFRQKSLGDWTSVIDEVCGELNAMTGRRPELWPNWRQAFADASIARLTRRLSA